MKKRNFISRLALLLVLAMSVSAFFTACSKDKNDGTTSETVYYTVEFNTAGGNKIESMKIASGQRISKPIPPTRENYIFVEWRYQLAPWSFEADKVTCDMTLTAHWIAADSVFLYDPIEGSGNAVITGFKNLPELSALAIPEILNGYNVTAIGDGAFAEFNSNHITSITIPETVTSVGSYAFEDITAKLTLKGELTHIGEGAFMGCTALESIKLGNGLTALPFSAFHGCSSLKSVIIPEGVTLISEDAFKDCSSIVTVVIPSGVTEIENSAFDGCEALKTVFFGGTEEAYDTITIDEKNEALESASVCFYAEEKPASSGYWHFDEDGKPTLWQE